MIFCAIFMIVTIIFTGVPVKGQSNIGNIYYYMALIPMGIMLFCFFFIVIYAFVSKGYIILGDISISEYGITTEINGVREEISTDDIKSCVFKLKGFDGESPIMRSSSFQGNYNYITFKTDNKEYYFEFYISNFQSIRYLYNDIVAEWKNKDINVTFNYPNHKFAK